MSDDLPLSPGEGDDLLAAEYVLGTLPWPERLEAEGRLRRDPAFAARVTAWEVHFAPLNDDYAEETPPDLMPAIEARLFGKTDPVPARPSPRRWFLAALGVTAAAAVLGVYVMQQGQQPMLTAKIATSDGALVFTASFDPGRHMLTISRTTGPGPAAAHDYELWVIAPGKAPTPMGLVSVPTRKMPAPQLAVGYTLAVSLEPAGGSPNGKPTTVLGAGALTLS